MNIEIENEVPHQDKAQPKFKSIRTVLNQSAGISAKGSHLLANQYNKLDKTNEDNEMNRDMTQSDIEKEQILGQQRKFKLNIDTDSEEDSTPKHGEVKRIQQNNSLSIDAQIRNQTQLTKAKQNASVLFTGESLMKEKTQNNSINKVNAKKGAGIKTEKSGSMNSSQNIIVNGKEETNPKNIQNQENTSKLKPPSRNVSSTNIPAQGGIELNSSYLEEQSEEICFLRGLSQNFSIDDSCALNEYLDNDKINIDMKTTDFFTFIRLQDEIDELKRKHNDFEKQKQSISQKQKQQQQHQQIYAAFILGNKLPQADALAQVQIDKKLPPHQQIIIEQQSELQQSHTKFQEKDKSFQSIKSKGANTTKNHVVTLQKSQKKNPHQSEHSSNHSSSDKSV